MPAAAASNVPRNISGTIEGDGSAVISRTELLASIKGKDSLKSSVELAPKNFPWLKKVSGGYSNIIWYSVKIFWKPAVGTSTNGSIVIGVDWGHDIAEGDITREKVQALSPMLELPVWQAGKSLTLPSAKLMSRKFYDLIGTAILALDRSPGNVLISLIADATSTEKFYGDIWVTYKVKLLNPTAY